MTATDPHAEGSAAELAQKAILDWFAGELARSAPASAVERVVTHAAVVLLAGDRAYKFKRAVCYPYLDFSTLERRENALRRELELNRRSAPSLYLRVFPIRQGQDGAFLPLETDAGTPAEWVLEMERFDRSQELDRLALRGELGSGLIECLAGVIAAFHGVCEVRPKMGGAAEMKRLVKLNTDQLEDVAPKLGQERIAALERLSMAALGRHKALLEHRRRSGFVRHCHGDLHLGNIVRIGGRPVLFDCIEFDDRIACIDTLYDLAFLLMDLGHSGRKDSANRLLNSYLDAVPYSEYAASLEGLALLPLFLSIRAAIRAHIAARRRGSPGATPEHAAGSYLLLAEDMLRQAQPGLVAIGGLSGSGKSTLARLLAPQIGGPLGALVLRSDVLRKRMLGVRPTDRLDDSAYAASMSAQVYSELMDGARRVVQAGQWAILDAVFLREDERRAASDLAASLGVPFTGLWLGAPYHELTKRLGERRHDASDATPAVLDRQRSIPLGDLDWIAIDSSPGIEETLRRARALF